MRKIVLLLLTLFTSAGLAEARQQDSAPLLKKWDAAVTIAAAHVRPAHNEGSYYDNWFFEGRYAAQIGRYLTEHIKTEMEYARFGEGSIFFQGYQRLAGID